jgi:geranylgeranyl pyrophosphate synthase
MPSSRRSTGHAIQLDTVEKCLEKLKKKVDAEMEKILPRQAVQEDLTRMLGKSRHGYNLSALNNTLNKPIWDILDRGGKRWRPALFLFIAEALGGDGKKLQEFSVIPELIHNGSIMVDDIEDDGELRRGLPCTHRTFGVDVAINAGNFLYFMPLLLFSRNRCEWDDRTALRVYEIFVQEMTRIHAGQATDIWWHRGNENPTEAQYMQMCVYKTGTLFRMAARFAIALSGGSAEMEETIGAFAETVGVAFQIQDDILDLVSSGKGREKFGKAIGNDIKEGKRTLLVIHALAKASEKDRKRLSRILDAHTSDPGLIEEAVSILNQYGSIAYAKEKSRELVSTAWKGIEPLLKKSHAKKQLKELAFFLTEREF